MFQELLLTVKENISTVRSIIKTNERLRKIAFGEDALIKQESREYKELFSTLIQDIPSLKEWRVYDHCSVVTRLYAIYENFAEDLLKNWLELVHGLFPR